MIGNQLEVIDIQIIDKLWQPLIASHKNELMELCQACVKDEHELGFPQYENFPQNRTYELSIMLVNKHEIQSLNRKWRQKDKATNILSFSAIAGENIFPPNGSIILGDLVIAYETVEEEARCANISFIDHLKRLIIHGVFHLLGYDHVTDNEFAHMARREYKLLTKFHIHNYIDDLHV